MSKAVALKVHSVTHTQEVIIFQFFYVLACLISHLCKKDQNTVWMMCNIQIFGLCSEQLSEIDLTFQGVQKVSKTPGIIK